jgi:hypothetical protein
MSENDYPVEEEDKTCPILNKTCIGKECKWYITTTYAYREDGEMEREDFINCSIPILASSLLSLKFNLKEFEKKVLEM